MDIVLQPIGVIHSPYTAQAGTPIQSVYAPDARGSVTLFEPYSEAVADLEGFERIWLIYHLHQISGWQPRVVPYRDTVERGVFATRSPARPNAIGLSVVSLLAVDGATLTIAGVDVLDGTPLVDIKPYVPAFDCYPGSRAGWLDASGSTRTRADDRFVR
jgi:tRNA (adenine37-N6)-methyltransferase